MLGVCPGRKFQALVYDILPSTRCRKAMLGVCPGRPPRLSHSSWTMLGQFTPKRLKYRRRHPFFPFFIHRRALSSLNQSEASRTGQIFPEHAERSFLDTEYTFVAGRRIPRTRCAKQKFSQPGTGFWLSGAWVSGRHNICSRACLTAPGLWTRPNVLLLDTLCRMWYDILRTT